MIDQGKYLRLVQDVFETGYLQKGAAIANLAAAIGNETDPLEKSIAATIVFAEFTKGLESWGLVDKGTYLSLR